MFSVPSFVIFGTCRWYKWVLHFVIPVVLKPHLKTNYNIGYNTRFVVNWVFLISSLGKAYNWLVACKQILPIYYKWRCSSNVFYTHCHHTPYIVSCMFVYMLFGRLWCHMSACCTGFTVIPQCTTDWRPVGHLGPQAFSASDCNVHLCSYSADEVQSMVRFSSITCWLTCEKCVIIAVTLEILCSQ